MAIARVWVAAWHAAYTGLMPAEYLAALDAQAALPALLVALRSNPTVLVLELGAEIVGFSVYNASRDSGAGPDTGEVIAINLHPSCWRRGLGRALLQQTLQRLSARGFSRATLWVLHGNANARRFYEALGWRCDDVEKQDERLTGFALHEVQYRFALWGLDTAVADR